MMMMMSQMTLFATPNQGEHSRLNNVQHQAEGGKGRMAVHHSPICTSLYSRSVVQIIMGCACVVLFLASPDDTSAMISFAKFDKVSS